MIHWLITALLCLLFVSPAQASQVPDVLSAPSTVQLMKHAMYDAPSLADGFAQQTFGMRTSVKENFKRAYKQDDAPVVEEKAAAAKGGRTWRPGPALWVGWGLSLAGGLVGGIIDGLIGLPIGFGALGSIAGAAVGVHLFSAAGIGWELLGALIGWVVALPIALVVGLVVVVALFGAATAGSGVGVGTVIVGAVLTSLVVSIFPAVGAKMAAKKDCKNKGLAFNVTPTMIRGSQQNTKLVPGMALTARF